jgi:GntR family transcriptional regulator
MIKKGVRDAILKRERTKFLKEEWPLVKEKMERLGIDVKSLADEE